MSDTIDSLTKRIQELEQHLMDVPGMSDRDPWTWWYWQAWYDRLHVLVPESRRRLEEDMKRYDAEQSSKLNIGNLT